MAYATVGALRARLGQQKSSQDDDLQRYLNAATEQVNKHTGRVFTKVTASQDTETRVYRPEWSNVALVDDFVIDVDTVVERRTSRTGDWTALTVDVDFVFEPLNGMRDGRTWSTDRITVVAPGVYMPASTAWPSLRLTARFGWPAVPEEVVEATLLQAAKLADRKGSPAGTLGVDGFGAVVRVQQGLDRDAAFLLAPFMREISR